MGFEFKSANKGCEALAYAFLSILEDISSNNEIAIYNFTGTELGEIPEHFRMFEFHNVTPKLKDIKCTYIRAVRNCDYIFDVTMGDSFSDIYSKDYYDYLIRNKEIVSFINNRYILLPQTYGPFEYEDSIHSAKKVLKRSYRIYCRDKLSQSLLENKFNIHNSILSPDMAFVLQYDKNMYHFSHRDKLGLNVSGLLYKGGFNKDNQFGLTVNYRELVEQLICSLSKKYEVHLIPHVIDLAENAYDDDYKICMKLHTMYPNTYLSPAFTTPIQAKSYISNMDIFIGSRMHSTIGAFSSGVLTIPISYSRKFEGLFGSLNYPYTIDARTESTESAYDKVYAFIEKKQELIQSQEKALELIEHNIYEFKNSLKELF